MLPKLSSQTHQNLHGSPRPLADYLSATVQLHNPPFVLIQLC